MIENNSLNWKYKGASISGYYSGAFNNIYVYQTIDYLIQCGVNAIQIVITWYQEDLRTSNIHRHPSKSVPDKDLIKIIRYIRKKGLVINLNPHVDLQFDSKEWRAKIAPENISLWFDNYRKFLVHFLDIAIEHDLELFTIGTEMISMSRKENLEYWIELVSFLREYKNHAYRGKLSYIADKTEVFGLPSFTLADGSVMDVLVLDGKFWELFDIISISAFFEVGNLKQDTPDVESVKSSWENKWIKNLKSWRSFLDTGKKVIIGEIGYRSIDFTHLAPALHYDNEFTREKYHFNEKIQANCLEGMFQALKNVEWIEGIFLWEEEINAPPFYYDLKNTRFSIINKQAAQVVAKFFRNDQVNESIENIPVVLVPAKSSLLRRVLRLLKKWIVKK